MSECQHPRWTTRCDDCDEVLYVEPANEPPSTSCRHCGDPIRPGTRGTWVHVHGLNRCQRPNRRYGYDALPDSGVPCGCVMCTTWGEMTPDVE